jgi:hypothetical protein
MKNKIWIYSLVAVIILILVSWFIIMRNPGICIACTNTIVQIKTKLGVAPPQNVPQPQEYPIPQNPIPPLPK